VTDLSGSTGESERGPLVRLADLESKRHEISGGMRQRARR